jgi:flagellar hook-length control protein FliK
MELVAPLPTELVGVLDLAARGAAPLLRSVADDSDTPAAAAPFGLFLELLAAVLPAGESLPLAGNGLPVPLLGPSANPTGAPTTMPPTPAPLPLTGAAFAAGLRLEGAASFASPSTAVAPAAAPPGPTLPLAPAPDVAPAARPPPLAEPLTLPAVPRDLPATPFGADAPTVDPALEPPARPTPRETFATAPEPRLRPPPPLDACATPSATLAPTGGESRAAAPPSEVAAPVLRVVQRDGSHFTLRPVPAAADAAGALAADWLPQATGQTSAHAATAPPTASATAQASLDLNAPDWHEAFASRVQWLVDHRVGEARIKLNPPELGALDVKISLVDDQTFVHLTAATAGARDELSQSLPRLRELLTASGLELGGASVESGRDGRREANGYAGQGSARLGHDLDPGRHDEHSPAASRRTAGRVDVFA